MMLGIGTALPRAARSFMIANLHNPGQASTFSLITNMSGTWTGQAEFSLLKRDFPLPPLEAAACPLGYSGLRGPSSLKYLGL